jgi:hypothetical protein
LRRLDIIPYYKHQDRFLAFGKIGHVSLTI